MSATVKKNIERMQYELNNMRYAYHKMMSYNAKIDQQIETATEEELNELLELRKKVKKYIKFFSRRMDKPGRDFDNV